MIVVLKELGRKGVCGLENWNRTKERCLFSPGGVMRGKGGMHWEDFVC